MIHWHLVLVSLLVIATGETSPPGSITKDVFGSYKVPEKGDQESQVYRYTLTNGQSTVQVVEHGATITAIKVPDSSGKLEDILLGFNDLDGYVNNDKDYFGATVGRVANRIAEAQFTLDGVTYKLNPNNGRHTLHGGLRGFDKKLWTSRIEDDRLVMEYISPDGEEGFPGEVTVSVTYSFTIDNTLIIEYKASSTKRTPINLTNHAYFNLAGQVASNIIGENASRSTLIGGVVVEFNKAAEGRLLSYW